VSEPRLTVHRSGPPEPWVGQLVTIEVDVWRPQGVAPLEPFNLDAVDAPGMIAKWNIATPPPDERREGDTTFLVQHRELLVFPQADGVLELPPLVARWHDSATDAEHAVSSTALRFSAAVPEGAGDPLPLVARSVSLTQTFDRELSGLRVGDGFTRTITLRATDSDPIVFPELTLESVSGLRAYVSPPKLGVDNQHGAIEGQLALVATYVVERVGPHTLQGPSIRWLNPGSGRYERATVADVGVWAAPNPALGLHCLGTARGADVATGLGLLALSALVVLGVRRWRRGAAERRARSSERRAFHALLAAVRGGSALEALDELYAWLHARAPDAGERTLAPVEQASPEAERAVATLERGLFRDPPTRRVQSGLAGALRRARRALEHKEHRTALIGLNGTASVKGDLS
jgi:hypothetical protein